MFTGKYKHPLSKQLTVRESEVLALVSEGYTNASIAEALSISIKTVENHLGSMYAKLKEISDFTGKHPRVTATRLCLQEADRLLP